MRRPPMRPPGEAATPSAMSDRLPLWIAVPTLLVLSALLWGAVCYAVPKILGG